MENRDEGPAPGPENKTTGQRSVGYLKTKSETSAHSCGESSLPARGGWPSEGECQARPGGEISRDEATPHPAASRPPSPRGEGWHRRRRYNLMSCAQSQRCLRHPTGVVDIPPLVRH